jgi:CBS domain containing-hemolysin-like protein
LEADLWLFVNLIVIALLLFSNGFFVASEFALVSVRKTRLQQLANEGSKNAKLALNSTDHIDRSIAAVQLGITISSIGLGWVGEATLVKMIEPIFSFLPQNIQSFATHSLAVAIAFSLVTFLHVVIGELMPKSIALQNPEKTALIVAKPMYAIIRIFKPFIWILNGFGNFLLSLIKVPPAGTTHLVHSPEELDMLIDESHKEGVLNDTEKEILQNVFKFSDTLAKEIMVPRPDVLALDINLKHDELAKIVLESQYTRYPVYEEDLDHIIGILHVKDIYPLIYADKTINLKELLREPILVPETMTIDNVMLEFKQKKSQIAVVMDEFGCVSGIVTLEDILEEIFGDVQDEFDEEEADLRQIYEDEYIANAMMRIDEFNEYFETNFEDEDNETLGGLVVKHLGHIANDSENVDIENFNFKVLEVDGARIVKLKIKKYPIEETEAAEQQKLL